MGSQKTAYFSATHYTVEEVSEMAAPCLGTSTATYMSLFFPFLFFFLFFPFVFHWECSGNRLSLYCEPSWGVLHTHSSAGLSFSVYQRQTQRELRMLINQGFVDEPVSRKATSKEQGSQFKWPIVYCGWVSRWPQKHCSQFAVFGRGPKPVPSLPWVAKVQ